MLIGGKRIFESGRFKFEGIEEVITKVTHRLLLKLAIATSIDAMAAGFVLTLLDINLFLACFIIGITPFVFSYIGVFIGGKSGTWLESKAEFLGGVVLILIGLKMLLW